MAPPSKTIVRIDSRESNHSPGRGGLVRQVVDRGCGTESADERHDPSSQAGVPAAQSRGECPSCYCRPMVSDAESSAQEFRRHEFKLRHVRLVIALENTRSITAAAESLGISQVGA